MKKIKNHILVFILIVIFGSSLYLINQNKENDINSIDLKDLPYKEFNLDKEDYLEDFNYAYGVLEQYYPFFEINKKLYGIDWLSNKEEYEIYILESKNDQDFYNKMNDVLAELNNLHTQLLDDSYGLFMYLTFYNVPDANWRHDISKLYEKENVRRRYKINNQNIKNYIDENIKNESLKSTDIRYDNLTTDIIIKDKLAYIKIKSLLGELYRQKDEEVLGNFLEEIKNYPNLIIDIRGNGGGDSGYWQEFLLPKIIDRDYQTITHNFIKSGELNQKIYEQERFNPNIEGFLKDCNFDNEVKEIIKDFDYYSSYTNIVKASKDSIRYKGNIYLLVDEGVYSSSEMLASFCKETGLAKLVGTRTGGDGIGFDPMQVDLPNSGYILRFSDSLGVTESGHINELDKTLPDFLVEDDVIAQTKKLEDQEVIKRVIKDAGI